MAGYKRREEESKDKHSETGKKNNQTKQTKGKLDQLTF
jgi:hypothetical protein